MDENTLNPCPFCGSEKLKIETKSGCEKQFSLDTVQKIAKALEIDVKDLFNKLD